MVATAYSVEANKLFIRSENPDGEALCNKAGRHMPVPWLFISSCLCPPSCHFYFCLPPVCFLSVLCLHFPCFLSVPLPACSRSSPCGSLLIPMPPAPPLAVSTKNSENDAGFLFLLLHCVGPPRTGWDFLSGEISTPGGGGGRQQGARPIVHPQACFKQCVCQASLYRQEHLLTSDPRIALTLFFLTKVTNNMSMQRIFLNSLVGKLCYMSYI